MSDTKEAAEPKMTPLAISRHYLHAILTADPPPAKHIERIAAEGLRRSLPDDSKQHKDDTV